MAETHVVNCEAGCGEKPKIAPVRQATAEIFTSGAKTTVSESLQAGAGLVKARERMAVGVASKAFRH